MKDKSALQNAMERNEDICIAQAHGEKMFDLVKFSLWVVFSECEHKAYLYTSSTMLSNLGLLGN